MFGLIRTTIIALDLAFNAGSTLAQDFQKGFVAAQSGDYVTALQEWRPFAEQGNAQAQHNLGFLYDNGLGVLQDHAEAAKWYRLAAEQGVAQAHKAVGILYEYGAGVLQDTVRTHMWYNIAAANGHKKSGEWRDERAGLMTLADISNAQSMAKECMSSNYQNCGW